MEQLNFILKDRYGHLNSKKDLLVKLNEIIPWEIFRSRLKGVWRESERERKPWDRPLLDPTRPLPGIASYRHDQGAGT